MMAMVVIIGAGDDGDGVIIGAGDDGDGCDNW